MLKNYNKKHGFSLIELSIVLLIMGLMVGGIMAVMTQESRRAKQAELKIKMDAIEQALMAFVKKNNALPCPADSTYLVSSQYFGVEGGTPGDGTCTTGATYDGDGIRTADTTPPTANFVNSNIAGGTVPVRSLGLADKYAFDPWGGRFTYSIDKRFTATDAFSSYTPNNITGDITINDNSGNTRSSNAIISIISHGENGHGAFQLSGTRKTAGSTNANELINCHCSNSSVTTAYASTFVMGENTTTSSSDLRASFDDIVRYYTRYRFLNDADIVTETY